MFRGFPFGGDFGGSYGRGEPQQQRKKNVDTNEYYELLGVAKDASPEEIRKAYRRMAVKHHPDKGGDEAKFKQIQEAANVLMDEEKRRIYDEHGKDGLEGGDMGDMNGDLLSQLFGGGGARRERRREVAPIKKQVEVSLNDLYCGRSFELPISRKRVCVDCGGSGASKPGLNATCDECSGHGARIIRQQIAPGFVQQMQVQCDRCQGTGSYIPKQFLCKGCKGEKISDSQTVLQVHINKGMQHGEKIAFRGEGHIVPDLEPGDVVVILACREHEQFKRKGNDLLINLKVSLAEALNPGTKVTLKHMDDRILSISREQDTLIKPGMVVKVDEEGMPKKENPNVKGDLYIQFSVVFPDRLPAATLTDLTKLLDGTCDPHLVAMEDEGGDEPWECTMHEVSLDRFGHKSARGRQAYDEEEEDGDHPGHGGVQCQQM
eukprot:c32675_g1_i1.p1 GENE.c32675_g1_i1~~c32675_g1_i1.p1  ORF type:complete len:433 (-),score=95.27 c32675_g1_i1:27-1325(-)